MLIRFMVASALAPPVSAAAAEPSPNATAEAPAAPVSAAAAKASGWGGGALVELSLAFFFFEGGAATAAEVARSAAALAFCSSPKEPVGGAALPSCAASIVGRDGRCFRSSRHAQQQKRQEGEFFEN